MTVEDQQPLATLGILGAGRVGSAIAKRAAESGIDVKVATAKDPREISLILEFMAPGAKAVTAAEASAQDVVILAVPLHKYEDVDPASLAGKIVVDAMNYWAPTDGTVDKFENDPRTSSEVVQSHFSESRVVKAFNHIGYHEFASDGRPAGDPDRRALAVAGDDAAGKAAVMQILEVMGYDAADIGPLSAGVILEPGTRIFSGRQSLDSLVAIVAEESVLAG
ncbi:NADPH-dependent F420 reductase [Neomicrococcus aestuarii]|uniref:NADPH-dependent F420 reductase n=1 Tax=Neomicrococcus aestuarii TaxID=556325 RepID=UPI001610BE56